LYSRNLEHPGTKLESDTKENAEDVEDSGKKHWHTLSMNVSQIIRWWRRDRTNSRMLFEKESRNFWQTIYDQRFKRTKRLNKGIYRNIYEDCDRI
jgi:hypothetical protein